MRFGNVWKGIFTVAGMASLTLHPGGNGEHPPCGALPKSTSQWLCIPLSTGLAAWGGDTEGGR